jgi:hypothetical protein
MTITDTKPAINGTWALLDKTNTNDEAARDKAIRVSNAINVPIIL